MLQQNHDPNNNIALSQRYHEAFHRPLTETVANYLANGNSEGCWEFRAAFWAAVASEIALNYSDSPELQLAQQGCTTLSIYLSSFNGTRPDYNRAFSSLKAVSKDAINAVAVTAVTTSLLLEISLRLLDTVANIGGLQVANALRGLIQTEIEEMKNKLNGK